MLSRLSHVQLFATPCTVARQASLSMGFSKQEYWSGLPFPLLGDLPDSGIESVSLRSLALAGGYFTTCTTWEDPFEMCVCKSQPFPVFLQAGKKELPYKIRGIPMFNCTAALSCPPVEILGKVGTYICIFLLPGSMIPPLWGWESKLNNGEVGI